MADAHSDRQSRPASTTGRLAEIRRHHGDDRPCSMRNDECFLLAEAERLRALLRELLAHDEHHFGPWTMGMRDRVREAIGGSDG